MDSFSKKTRSWIMAQVKSHGNRSTEAKLLEVLRENSITGWRRNYALIGRPDFVFPKARVAVFVDGCFWHGHPLKCRMPQTNRAYWEGKIARNVTRDQQVTDSLKKQGWKVVRIWEDSVANSSTLARLRKALAWSAKK
ncbi:MAG: DNA mismatch endonuclease Vsr [Nitrospira defluvii]|nr:DNA mismatch endonuclease Vsr [Nitrospira defluvii]